jgi:hypothetical protein
MHVEAMVSPAIITECLAGLLMFYCMELDHLFLDYRFRAMQLVCDLLIFPICETSALVPGLFGSRYLLSLLGVLVQALSVTRSLFFNLTVRSTSATFSSRTTSMPTGLLRPRVHSLQPTLTTMPFYPRDRYIKT